MRMCFMMYWFPQKFLSYAPSLSKHRIPKSTKQKSYKTLQSSLFSGFWGVCTDPLIWKRYEIMRGFPKRLPAPPFFSLAGKIIFQESRIAHAFAAMQHILVYIISFCLITRFTLADPIQANITTEEKPSGRKSASGLVIPAPPRTVSYTHLTLPTKA